MKYRLKDYEIVKTDNLKASTVFEKEKELKQSYDTYKEHFLQKRASRLAWELTNVMDGTLFFILWLFLCAIVSIYILMRAEMSKGQYGAGQAVRLALIANIVFFLLWFLVFCISSLMCKKLFAMKNTLHKFRKENKDIFDYRQLYEYNLLEVNITEDDGDYVTIEFVVETPKHIVYYESFDFEIFIKTDIDRDIIDIKEKIFYKKYVPTKLDVEM